MKRLTDLTKTNPKKKKHKRKKIPPYPPLLPILLFIFAFLLSPPQTLTNHPFGDNSTDNSSDILFEFFSIIP